jgi:hypothetical protein
LKGPTILVHISRVFKIARKIKLTTMVL